MDKMKLKYEDVVYEMAAPARKLEILLWLLTGGRKGKLFIRETKDFRKWMAPPSHTNCRCL